MVYFNHRRKETPDMKYEKTRKEISSYAELDRAIKSAGAWFIGSFMVEFVDEFDKLADKEKKKDFIEYFYKEYYEGLGDKKELIDKINIAIRIIESEMVEEAMKYVLDCNDKKIGCDMSKTNAILLMERLADGSSILPEFE